MDLLLKNHKGQFMERVNFPVDGTVEDFKTFFYEKHRFYPERQRWTVNSLTGPVLTGNKLTENGVTDGTSLYFKDLGVQISWRLVFFMEYLGPLFILPLLYFFPSFFYRTEPLIRYCSQKCGFVMLMFHFLKREFETFFVHRFSKETMPIKNLFTNCFHYWVLCAIGIGYYLFHPNYRPVLFFTRGAEKIILFALFFLFQFLTFMTHLTLCRLRPKGTVVRGIPRDWGFQYVSCANYFWELLIWVDIALFVNTLTGYFFAFAVFLILANWAKKKHNKYLKEFPNYPKNRKALIPFLF
ncbi:3-oxo-5-alpha-steroid 4-dehydrogenase family protein [Theileria parva strain Muguga]|uniref:3-oxo-5-alpha-steroid 4-dehydrogenase, putative n=1 Tax=Theileria parva TaxID=5875 RepID=Q4MZ35_THEPA|nr:3-oxo-5-alpha-steroid 4-dehydrogenase family protein [Theileria parva strain Muguga]EAN30497.1 3-oxo-5-alpha-steroid 4-dehydrogenase family protein [Theileria parva strain Muguga]|eukprot:XP_762780.1 3-oxo-5-alpha-steroid 4-dehydrogenase [Theileria parva strain Muguga]